MRVAVLDRDICKPTDCAVSPNKPCIKYCPRVRTGDQTIELGPDGYPYLNQALCSGCGICVKKCPFHCYNIINVPEKLDINYKVLENIDTSKGKYGIWWVHF